MKVYPYHHVKVNSYILKQINKKKILFSPPLLESYLCNQGYPRQRPNRTGRSIGDRTHHPSRMHCRRCQDRHSKDPQLSDVKIKSALRDYFWWKVNVSHTFKMLHKIFHTVS